MPGSSAGGPCIAVVIGLSASVSQRRLHVRRLGLGFRLCIFGGGGGDDGVGSGGGRRRRLRVSADESLGVTASVSWNKVLQISLSFVGVYSGAGVGSVSCTGVWFFFLGVAAGVLFAGFGVAAWCSGKVEAGGRGAELGEPTTDDLSSRVSCNFPKIGVRSLFSKGEDGRLKIRRVAHQGRSYTYLLMSVDIDDFMQNQ